MFVCRAAVSEQKVNGWRPHREVPGNELGIPLVFGVGVNRDSLALDEPGDRRVAVADLRQLAATASGW